MTFDIHQKQYTSCTYCGTPAFQIWDLLKPPFLRYHVYKVFTIWPLLTPNDLWPPPKTIGFLYSMWYTYIPNMRSVQASLLEISCLQGLHNLTPVDPKWPLTSTKNNRLLVLNVMHLHTKYDICPSFPSWDIVFTSWASHHTRTHTHTHTHLHDCKGYDYHRNQKVRDSAPRNYGCRCSEQQPDTGASCLIRNRNER